jgi:putative transposase
VESRCICAYDPASSALPQSGIPWNGQTFSSLTGRTSGLPIELLADYKKPEDIIGENGLLKQLTKALLERAMQAEMTDHLGYEKHDPGGNNSGNSRNGSTTKTLKGDFGETPLETPRDRNGSYEPRIIGKGQTRFTGFDDKIVSMYARGMSTREIQGHLEAVYNQPRSGAPVGTEANLRVLRQAYEAIGSESRR